ncbi:hypothetical protein [Streptomyces sedi]|uniref:Uncharacterized protein n=1 Tax=Streptomyces sedi TaxID=555059 RepID=A0A5C4V484_9ACTN|nr:hypothetical protein [Streptomyces sedi]TNM30568.1 hypothetical protein FH715_11205 [Streptomyces sedi]
MTPAPVSFQALLARALTAPDLLREIREDPDAFADREGLPRDEVRRLAAMRPQGLDATSWIAREKTREQIRALYPATITVAGTLPGAGELLAYGPPGGRLDRPGEAAAAGRRLEELAARAEIPGEGRRSVFLDLIRFETLWYEARAGLLAGRETGTAPRGPALRPGAVLASFGCEVVAAHRATLAAGRLADTAERPTTYLVAAGAGGRISTVRLTPSTRAVLAGCDGSTPVARLAEATGHRADRIDALLAGLWHRGLVVLPHAPSRPAPPAHGHG